MKNVTPLSLYLHIPFCRHRCSYCDFNTYTSLNELKEGYARALCQEIHQVASGQVAGGLGNEAQLHFAARRPVQTIFFGGGTPSLMPSEAVGQILATVRDCFELAAGAEITMEANPGTVDEAYLAAIRAVGVNRLSFGAQSAIASELALLEREHDFSAVVAAVGQSRAAGFDNLNLDFIYGLPGQTLDNWRQTLEAALALKPEHLSLYCLTIEPGTPMQRWLRSGRIAAPDPDLASDQYELACELLGVQSTADPYMHYEISNWALPGHECRHNLTYWRNNSYLGLGAGAHGFAAGYRYHVVKQPRVYIRRMQTKGPAIYPFSAALAEKRFVNREEAMTETIITQLRLLQEGLDLDAFATTFGQTFHERFGRTVAQLESWDLLRQAHGRLLLTGRGRFLSNQVFYRFT